MFSPLIRDVVYSFRQCGCFSAWDAGKKAPSCTFLTAHALINSVVRFSGMDPAHGCCSITTEIYFFRLEDKVSLDGVLSSLVWWVTSLPLLGALRLDDLKEPFQLKSFCDFIIKMLLLLGIKLLSGTCRY